MKTFVVRKVDGGFIVEQEGRVNVTPSFEAVLAQLKDYFGENVIARVEPKLS